MKLYLMRHAQALASTDDPQRGLSAHGRLEIQDVMAQAVARLEGIEQVLHSGVLRAAQTAQMVAKTLDVEPISAVSWLGESDDIGNFLAMLPAWDSDTLVVSHYPFLMQLIAVLLAKNEAMLSEVQFSTATLVCLEKTSSGWQLSWVISPRM